ncbi:hypothetical protein ABZ805_19810 [Saccharopolyspora sp. NPDC047091]|uniref:hypothetical protein n=1 Tax=Saccharopolyspora sp. NPDC047091 TaxID=3155924 RepID=UPI0033F77FD9
MGWDVRRSSWIAGVVVVVLSVVGGIVGLANSDQWSSSCSGGVSRGSAADDVARSVRENLPSFSEGTSVSVEVVDLDACAEIARLDADSGFPTASVVKLLIAIDAVERSGGDTADGEIERMLSASDDDVASRLWTANGGPDIVRRVAAKLELTDTAPPRSSGRWGSTRMSASDVARVYRYLAVEADADTRTLLLDAMGQASGVAEDGFPQHFGIPGGLPGHRWAIKQGWGSTETDTVLHTTGLVRGDHDFVVVLLSTWPRDTDWAVARSALTEAVRSLDGIV